MFCPECRRYWSGAPASAQGEARTDAPRGAQAEVAGAEAPPERCPSCGSLLARDRLVAEFPPSEQAQQAGRGGRERRLTIQEVLRETSAPHSLAGFEALPSGSGPTPPDDLPVPPPRKLFGRLPIFKPKTSWDSSDEPRVPRGFGRPGGRVFPLDVILGFGALGAIVLLMVSMGVKTIATGVHTNSAVGAPTATLVRASALGEHSPSGTGDLGGLLPAAMGAWTRSSSIRPIAPLSGMSEGASVVAAYSSGASSARVWIEQCSTSVAAQGIVQRALGRTPFVQLERLARQRTAVIDLDSAGNGAVAASTVPGTSAYAHTRLWSSGANVVTVSSDTSAARDALAKELIARLH